MPTKKTASKRVKTPVVSKPTERDILNALYDMSPELNEAFSRADIELALEDRGYMRMGDTKGASDMNARDRRQMITRSRLYWARDPLAHQVVRLWTDYGLNTGITVKCRTPEGDSDDKTQKIIDDFMESRKNRSLMSASGQRRSSKKLLIDGDVFFAIVDDGEQKIIRYLDAANMCIVSNPEDEEDVFGYKREMPQGKALFYRSWAADENVEANDEKGAPITWEEGVVVYHKAFDQLGLYGNGILNNVIDWTREHRRFMEARVAITQALSKFAWKVTTKAGQSNLNRLAARVQSSFAASGANAGAESNPAPAPGGTLFQNLGFDAAPMPRTTGGAEAKEDGDALKLQVAAGSGIMLHYFGDPSTGNLATATAMELPMLKMFEGYQKDWQEAYRDIFSIVLGEVDGAERAIIDIDFPPIVAEDLTRLGGFISSVTTAFPEMKVDEIVQMILVALRVNNVDDVMESITKKREEVDAQKAEDTAFQRSVMQAGVAAGGGNGFGGDPSRVKEACDLLTEAFRNLKKEAATE